MSTETPTAAATSEAPETREFQTEARQLLDLMIHSVYSHPEVFLRELVSNASDALDKLRVESLTDTDLAAFTADPHIRLAVDPVARTLTVADNGVGMSRDEVVRYIGTIAKSGTKEFAAALRAKGQPGAAPADGAELIGQFGVGFYSAFMVADRVELTTRRAGEDTATRWSSGGDGTYTLEPATRDEPGTTITLRLKRDAAGEGADAVTDDDGDDTPLSASRRDAASNGSGDAPDFTSQWTLRDIVRRYSDFVAYPIRMSVEKHIPAETDDEGEPKEGSEPRVETADDTLNSMKAIWTRPAADVTDEEYAEFYKHVSRDWTAPARRVAWKAEGTVEFRALLFIPAKAPFDLFLRAAGDEGSRAGVHLYVKRVFIMADARELIPEYLRFLRGVIDSEDLSLNVSREMLQKDRQVAAIRKGVVRKVIDSLRTWLRDDRAGYEKFWNEFGRVLKEGLVNDRPNRDALLSLCLFESTRGEGLTTLKEYGDRMKDGQDAVFHLTGATRAAASASPHLEAFRAKEVEVLLLSDPVDEVWTQDTFEHDGKRLRSAAKGDAELGTADERKADEEKRAAAEVDLKPLLEALRAKLDDRVKEVRLSTRLVDSPACLVGDVYDSTPQLEAMMRAMGQTVPKAKRILEINANHPVVEKLKAAQAAVAGGDGAEARDGVESSDFGDYAELLHGQALLAEGTPLPDPADFGRRVAALMAKAM